MKASKGSAFERKFCRQLSLWWTQDLAEPRDDVFWRTSNSGGRATTRRKKDLETCNQIGDICAVDPIGIPFLKAFTVECKRGYSKCTLQDILDKPKRGKKQQWEKWIEKLVKEAEQAKSLSWLLVIQRDRREALAITPWGPLTKLTKEWIQDFDGEFADPYAFLQWPPHDLLIIPLLEFLHVLDPEWIKARFSK